MNINIFWENLEDCESGLAAVYNAFKNSDNYIIIEETKRTDLAWPGTGGTNKFLIRQMNTIFRYSTVHLLH